MKHLNVMKMDLSTLFQTINHIYYFFSSFNEVIINYKHNLISIRIERTWAHTASNEVATLSLITHP